MTALVPPFKFECFLFLSLVWLLWLIFSVICWIRAATTNIPVLFLILRKRFLVFPLSMMVVVDFSYMAFTMFKYIPFIPTLLRVLITNGCWILSTAFSASIDMIMCILIVWFVYVVNHIYKFANAVPTLHFWNKSHLIMVYDLLDVLQYLVC